MPVTPTADRYVPQLPFTFGATPRVENGTTKPHPKLTIMKGSAVDVAAAATAKKRQCRMGPGSPVQFRPIDVDPKPMERSKLMDLGHVVQKSRDTLNCLSASLVAQLPPDASKQLGIVRAFGELGDAFAQDVKNATRDSFERGVAHGKWLESAGETTVADAHEEVAKVRRAFHELQLSYREMHVMYQEQIAQNAHLKACAKTPFTPGVHDFDVNLERVVDELDINDLLKEVTVTADGYWHGVGNADDSEVIAMLGDYVDSLPKDSLPPTPQNSPQVVCIAPHRQPATLSI